MTIRKGLASGFVARLWTMAALAFLLGTVATQAQTAVAPTSGTGTLANPYQITVLGNLAWMSNNVATEGVAGKCYKLMNDIDASDTWYWSGGFTHIGNSIKPFCGAFDGNGKTITGLSIRHWASTYVGLFGYIGSGGTVSNLTLSGCSVVGGDRVGGLAANNSGTITNCCVAGSVGGQSNVGGLVGYNGGTITDCCVTGDVSGETNVGGLIGGNYGTITYCYATGAVTATDSYSAAGGLVGFNEFGTITNCYASGAVSGTRYVAGLVGANGVGGWVVSCYATGLVSGGTLYVGGLVGHGYERPNGSYWDTQTSHQPTLWTSWEGIGRTTAQMKQQATFNGWDFVNVWGIVENGSYPFLKPALSAPLNVSPANNATGVLLAPTLIGSAFRDRNTRDTHAASQWQVWAADSPNAVFDSGASAVALTICPVPPGLLGPLTDYSWRVRYENNHGAWSAWSELTTFQTRNQPLSAPTGIIVSKGTFAYRVRMTWPAPAWAKDYMVYRSTHPTTTTALPLTDWFLGASYDDITAQPGIIYYYWVRAATNSGGGCASGFSASATGWAGSGPAFPSNYRGNLLIVY